MHLVAHQYDVACNHTHRDQVRHAHLASLVDEQIVQLLGEGGIGKQPRSAGRQINVRPPSIEKFGFVLDRTNAAASEFRTLSLRGLFQTLENEFLLLRRRLDSRQQVIDSVVRIGCHAYALACYPVVQV